MLAYVDAIICADSSQSSLISASDGVKFPFAVVFIQFAEYGGRFNGKVFSQIIAEDLLAVCFVYDTDKRIVDLSEVLPSLFRFVDRYRKSDLGDIVRDKGKIDPDLLVVPFSYSRKIVALMDYAAGRMSEISIEDKILLPGYFSHICQQEC